MKKTQKGLTLVEVLVAITVLSITMFALLSTIVAMRKVVARQEEYVKIKMVCQDIDAYWDKYKTIDNWDQRYFQGDISKPRSAQTVRQALTISLFLRTVRRSRAVLPI